ncbi:TlpA disulfide reductase family protein [Mangrovivirga sp. M17]|uniref:TlpA disulfide reductase family protein n=1 Tax=Mangrovivirga halotolerans TaxID=2993936 RepID=A0ABT3RRU2_9BACT|nr:TlpA disulfide reductase family protein [Mangrovivirga halotolerans]MCX2744273.1 TlpA disulfide reductase family protein [Mangrovivirga halotolerans]
MSSLQSLLIKIPFYEASVNNSGATSKEINENIYLLDETGNRIEHDFSDYDYTFINFWASWCPPCLAEMPSIEKLYQKTENRNIRFLMISSDQNFDKATQLKNKKNFTFSIYSPLSSIPSQLSHSSIPYTVIVDNQGNIIYEKEGIANYDSEEIINLFN